VPRPSGVYPGICLTTEEKARRNLSQGILYITGHWILVFKGRAAAQTACGGKWSLWWTQWHLDKISSANLCRQLSAPFHQWYIYIYIYSSSTHTFHISWSIRVNSVLREHFDVMMVVKIDAQRFVRSCYKRQWHYIGRLPRKRGQFASKGRPGDAWRTHH
jgi:hypothetical protein